MNGLTDTFDDRFEPLGVAGGVFLVVMSLLTILGMPWTTNGSLAVSLLQGIGILGTVAIGVALVWLARSS